MFPEDRMMEVLIIGALALIVIGPKDLPIAMRKLGQFIGRMRGMAAEFRASFDELARQSELEELRKQVEALRTSQTNLITSVNPLTDDHVGATFNEINQHLGEVSLSPAMSSQLLSERAAVDAALTATPPEPAITEVDVGTLEAGAGEVETVGTHPVEAELAKAPKPRAP
ncbi:MAG: Sec-independent protein translocase protein TatB, partial [Caulobacteraceae bacterium]|nr:Sec-independent protein translocase protein TatB [Caulobacteraceae bacterium]